MSEREETINELMYKPLDSLLNTQQILSAVSERNGQRHAENLAEQFCKMHRLPTMPYSEFKECLKSALIRKSIMVDERTETGSIIYGAGNVL
jgi:hypothetical protein